MAFKLKDLIINLLPPAGAGAECPTASAPGGARFCPTASADARFCPTASATIDARFCPTASAGMVFCPTASAPVLLVPAAAGQFCPTASAGIGGIAQFCPTASAGIAGIAQFCPTASAGFAAGVEAVCPTASAPTESVTLEGLAALKQQLQEALTQVEEQERALAASQLPQTLAEAEDLEARLRGALEELQRHKEGLKG